MSDNPTEPGQEPVETHSPMWSPGWVGARPGSFPGVVGGVTVAFGAMVRCSRPDCFIPTTAMYDGVRLCLSHALIAESIAAGRSEEKLLAQEDW